ncbi:hypothetical protein HanXRQr2_Chr03g0102391 [Helianthus annuus]|uniref:Uncharacterized protein n=1 Tax=Helianthus annuus TaxID=4232 RepID=A0A251V510_HELAN|nr:hypothetical protein HanXRQr2_Chr03g0102371 [Helianthus annuus]KAF5813752.1 hypothetical protein HanXRQr2_Chr03g0102391 [Helianthus annuus]
MKSTTNPTEMGGNIAVTVTGSPTLSIWVLISVCSRLSEVMRTRSLRKLQVSIFWVKKLEGLFLVTRELG